MPDIAVDDIVVVSLPERSPLSGGELPQPVTTGTVLAVPGPRGPIGPAHSELTPEQLQEIADATSAEVAEDLTPPVDLTILFENSLA